MYRFYTGNDLKIIADNKLRQEERQLQERLQKEAKEREFKNLHHQHEGVQLKYFVASFGPIDGKNKYTEWKSAQLFSKSTSEFASKVERNGNLAEDSDDELLNCDLIK